MHLSAVLFTEYDVMRKTRRKWDRKQARYSKYVVTIM